LEIVSGEKMGHNLYEIKKSLNKMDENTYNLSRRKPEPYKAGTIDEVIVRFDNAGCSPKPTPEMRLSTEKSDCKSDYNCCGRLP
jgi:hypothetical protein